MQTLGSAEYLASLEKDEAEGRKVMLLCGVVQRLGFRS